MKIYLSIDIDYFSCINGEKQVKNHRSQFITLLDRIEKLEVPVNIVKSHEKMVKHINNSKCDTLINIDFHSDYVDKEVDYLGEGTWVNYIDWKDKGSYIWAMPSEYCESLNTGFCHGESHHNPFKYKKHASWKSAKYQKGYNNIKWKKVEEVGICLSKYWVYDHNLFKILKIYF